VPAVSVIILAFNNGPLLTTAVASILDQTMSDLEVVLTDNCSTDGGVDQLLRQRPDPRIKVIRHATNTSVPDSFNLAVAQCSAPWIAIMDADDISLPMRLELQLKALAADPTLDFVTTGAEAIDADGKVIGPWPSLYAPEEIRGAAPYHMPIINPTLLGRAEIFRRLPMRSALRDSSDFDFIQRVIEAGGRIAGLPLTLFQYRRHAGSQTFARVADHEAMTCALRLCAARRRAGRVEDLEAMVRIARERATSLPLDQIYRRYARDCRAEGFPLLAALQAALAVRAKPSASSVFLFVRYLVAAMRADRGATSEALLGVLKGPFWILLRRAGFGGLPRY
jgi:glycosyltransferase involved in cell wall biosynthesis